MIKGKLFEGSIGLREVLWCILSEGRIVEDCWEMSPTLTNLGVDHRFISKEYIFIDMRSFGDNIISLWRVMVSNRLPFV